jgi:hypothetical protein
MMNSAARGYPREELPDDAEAIEGANLPFSELQELPDAETIVGANLPFGELQGKRNL